MDSFLAIVVAVIFAVALITIIGVFVNAPKRIRAMRARCEQQETQFENNKINHKWQSLSIFEAISQGMSIEYVDVIKNHIIIRTKEGLVNVKINQKNLPFLLPELKISTKKIYHHTDLYLNIDMNDQIAIIDNCKYSS